MAWTTGIATNYLDLLDKLETFLTSNAALVAAGQNWTTLRYSDGVDPSTYTGRIAFGSVQNGVTSLDVTPSVLPSTYFKARISGTLNAPEAGTYTVAIDGDDCIDLIIDGNLVASWYGSHTAEGGYSHNQQIVLTQGAHTFQVRTVQGAGTNLTSFGWKLPSGSTIEPVAAGYLSNMTLTWAAYGGAAPTSTALMDALFGQKQLIIKAPGLSGTDQIFIGIKPYSNVTGDYYNWSMTSFLGYSATDDVSTQPYSSPKSQLYLWNDQIKYWFIANGNRVIIVTKVSSVYQIGYIGKFLPYCLPTQYPYPVLVSGTHTSTTGRYSNADFDYSSILCPGAGTYFYYIDGTWKKIRNYFHLNGSRSSDSSASGLDSTNAQMWPTSPRDQTSDVLANTLAWTDGGYTLLPLVIDMQNPVFNVLGEVDGIMWVSGHQNASENIINVGGQDYLVVQNVWITSRADYMAVRLS